MGKKQTTGSPLSFWDKTESDLLVPVLKMAIHHYVTFASQESSTSSPEFMSRILNDSWIRDFLTRYRDLRIRGAMALNTLSADMANESSREVNDPNRREYVEVMVRDSNETIATLMLPFPALVGESPWSFSYPNARTYVKWENPDSFVNLESPYVREQISQCLEDRIITEQDFVYHAKGIPKLKNGKIVSPSGKPLDFFANGIVRMVFANVAHNSVVKRIEETLKNRMSREIKELDLVYGKLANKKGYDFLGYQRTIGAIPKDLELLLNVGNPSDFKPFRDIYEAGRKVIFTSLQLEDLISRGLDYKPKLKFAKFLYEKDDISQKLSKKFIDAINSAFVEYIDIPSELNTFRVKSESLPYKMLLNLHAKELNEGLKSGELQAYLDCVGPNLHAKANWDGRDLFGIHTNVFGKAKRSFEVEQGKLRLTLAQESDFHYVWEKFFSMMGIDSQYRQDDMWKNLDPENRPAEPWRNLDAQIRRFSVVGLYVNFLDVDNYLDSPRPTGYRAINAPIMICKGRDPNPNDIVAESQWTSNDAETFKNIVSNHDEYELSRNAHIDYLLMKKVISELHIEAAKFLLYGDGLKIAHTRPELIGAEVLEHSLEAYRPLLGHSP